MDRTRVIAAYRLGFAGLTVAAIVVQAASLMQGGIFDPVNFFSYFTILSNLLAVVVFLVGAARAGQPRTKAWELVRGAAVLYMTVTLIVYGLLLSGTDVSTQLEWVNTVVHRVFPVVLIADWLIDPPEHELTFRDSLVWLAFPLVWVAYTMIRGALVDRYPYPFLDPDNGGYGTVALYIVAILVFGIVLCWVLSWIGDRMRERRDPAARVAAA